MGDKKLRLQDLELRRAVDFWQAMARAKAYESEVADVPEWDEVSRLEHQTELVAALRRVRELDAAVVAAGGMALPKPYDEKSMGDGPEEHTTETDPLAGICGQIGWYRYLALCGLGSMLGRDAIDEQQMLGPDADREVA